MGAPVASKMSLPEKENCTQDFLNAGQYKKNGILRYERVFGHTFVSTGGLTTTKDIVDPIGLKPGMKVLDIGCGTGGSAFYMARNYGVDVHGIFVHQHDWNSPGLQGGNGAICETSCSVLHRGCNDH